ncbi:MAG TPA: XRE family transcriptional regulator [Gemmatimonadales bacterium]|nr:XRE family transcriptional regulator [Gemmatimonadales bacterium]
MAKKFASLRAAMRPEARARVEARVRAALAAMPLDELRRARQLSQETVAESLGVSQPAVSALERQADMYLSTLRRYVEAMGGELVIAARFPEGDVAITQFAELDREPADSLGAPKARGVAEPSSRYGGKAPSKATRKTGKGRRGK